MGWPHRRRTPASPGFVIGRPCPTRLSASNPTARRRSPTPTAGSAVCRAGPPDWRGSFARGRWRRPGRPYHPARSRVTDWRCDWIRLSSCCALCADVGSRRHQTFRLRRLHDRDRRSHPSIIRGLVAPPLRFYSVGLHGRSVARRRRTSARSGAASRSSLRSLRVVRLARWPCARGAAPISWAWSAIGDERLQLHCRSVRRITQERAEHLEPQLLTVDPPAPTGVSRWRRQQFGQPGPADRGQLSPRHPARSPATGGGLPSVHCRGCRLAAASIFGAPGSKPLN